MKTTGMASYQPGELVLVYFPFSSGSGGKNRSALVLPDTGDGNVLVARMTGRPPRPPLEVAVADRRGAGLYGLGTVRMHKLATFDKALVKSSIGHLQGGNRQRIASLLNHIFGKW